MKNLRKAVYPGLAALVGLSIGAPVAGAAGSPGSSPCGGQSCVASAPDRATGGIWEVTAGGAVYASGSAPFFGDPVFEHLDAPVVEIVPTADDQGYWLVASDGGVFAYGDAPFYGSMGGQHLNAPVVGMVPLPSGGGYWLFGADGGVFAFGQARFYGSEGANLGLPGAVVGGATTPDGAGYVLVDQDRSVYAFGDAGGYYQGAVSCAPDPGTGPPLSVVSSPGGWGANVSVQCDPGWVATVHIGPSAAGGAA